MPDESDYTLGREAVKKAVITQEQLEECIELLVALEKVGSRKKLYDVILDKGYATADQLDALKKGKPPAAVPPKKPDEEPLMEEIAPTPKAPAKVRAVRRNVVTRMRPVNDVPADKVSSYCFIHLPGGGKASLFVLPKKPIAIGRDAANDIRVMDGPVSKRHARITFAEDGMTIWDVGSKNGTFVNDEKITSKKLSSGDVVKVGESYLIFSRLDHPDGRIIDPIVPDADESEAEAVLSVSKGAEGTAEEGAAFYVGSRPLLIGSEAVNNIYIKKEGVSPFHAQVAHSPKGIRILDLNSETGVSVNGKRVSQKVLEVNDEIEIGGCVLHVDRVKQPVTEGARRRPKPGTIRLGFESALAQNEPKPGAGLLDELASRPAKKPIDQEATIIASREELMREAEEEGGLEDLGAALKAEAGIGPEAHQNLVLACITGMNRGLVYPIGDKPVTIGRSPKATVFLQDLSVSREHAMIKKTGGKIEIIDLGSRNGIEVNNKRVMTKVVKAGDKITIGKNTFIVQRAK